MFEALLHKLLSRGHTHCLYSSFFVKMGFLEVVIPPDFVPEETSGDTMVPEGGTARVSCRARGVPVPRVTWKREDGQEIVVRDHTGSKNKGKKYLNTRHTHRTSVSRVSSGMR